MPALSPWERPDRWEIRENPEPGVLAALYDTDYPEHGPAHQLLPDPESPEGEWLLARNVLRDNVTRRRAAAARRHQEELRAALNDRFQMIWGKHTLQLYDRMTGDPLQTKTVAQARGDRGGNRYTLEPDPQRVHRREFYDRDLAGNLLQIMQDALNQRPARPWAEEFAARYLQQHPYPEPPAAAEATQKEPAGAVPAG